MNFVFSLLTALALAAGAPTAPTPAPSVLGDEPLAPGTFAWQPELSPAGPVLILIDLQQQQAFVYRNGLRIARSSVSTGKPGYETPTGVFTILQKHREHYSNLYDDAPMPFMQRLTWSGVALHAGKLPGYPASHGCVRLPYAFSERLFGITSTGATVVIRDGVADPQLGAHAPFTSAAAGPAAAGAWSWQPERATAGPLTIVFSTRDGLAIVVRDSVEIGRAHVTLSGAPDAGTQVYMLLAGRSDRPSQIVPGRAALNWLAVGATRPSPLGGDLAARVSVPPEFSQRVYDALQPGTTVVITDESLSAGSTGAPLTILRADEPEKAPARPAIDTR